MDLQDEQPTPVDVHRKRPLGVQKRRALRLAAIIVIALGAFAAVIVVAWWVAG